MQGEKLPRKHLGPGREPPGVCDEARLPGRATAGTALLQAGRVLGHDWFSGGWQGLSRTSCLALSSSPRPHPQPHVSSDLAPQGLAPVSLVCLSRCPYGWQSVGLQGHLLGPVVTMVVPHGGPTAQSSGAPVQSWPRAPECWALSLPARPAGGPGWTWAPPRLLKGAVTPEGRGVPGSAPQCSGGTQRLSHLVRGGT